MNRSMMAGVVLGVTAVLSLGAVAGYKAFKGPAYADILEVKSVHEVVSGPEESCADEQVTKKAAVKDENRVAGTVIGGVVGGLLGNQVGGGTGKTLATIAGAAGGAYAGNQIQKGMQDRDTTTTSERRCKTVTKSQQKLVGYDVRYLLDGKEATVRTTTRPSEKRVRVEDGKLAFGEPERDGKKP
jgi:uncharacterized protein YcfJ